MKCLIGLGANLGDRQSSLEQAAQILAASSRQIRASVLFESAAVTRPGAPEEWHKPFLNAAIEIEWSQSPQELLQLLKQIERQLGRSEGPRWSPRLIDLDLLVFGNETVQEENLTVPHPELSRRPFVLSPLKHLCPSRVLMGEKSSILSMSRSLKKSLPLWMGIVNLTPDSFSQDGISNDETAFKNKINSLLAEHVQVLDLGAESTRPGAEPVTPEAEWHRLKPSLEWLKQSFRKQIFRPLISVDTYHPQTAAAALELGADIINDVSGLRRPGMLEILQDSNCQYVLMHSLSVPADPKHTLQEADPCTEVRNWALAKIDELCAAGISLERIIFDPGIGFGKTAQASLTLLKRIDQFLDLPVRVLVGHSRKSFLNQWGPRPVHDREYETLGVSLRLAERGVDIIRVHEAEHHARCFRAFQETDA